MGFSVGHLLAGSGIHFQHPHPRLVRAFVESGAHEHIAIADFRAGFHSVDQPPVHQNDQSRCARLEFELPPDDGHVDYRSVLLGRFSAGNLVGAQTFRFSTESLAQARRTVVLEKKTRFRRTSATARQNRTPPRSRKWLSPFFPMGFFSLSAAAIKDSNFGIPFSIPYDPKLLPLRQIRHDGVVSHRRNDPAIPGRDLAGFLVEEQREAEPLGHFREAKDRVGFDGKVHVAKRRAAVANAVEEIFFQVFDFAERLRIAEIFFNVFHFLRKDDFGLEFYFVFGGGKIQRRLASPNHVRQTNLVHRASGDDKREAAWKLGENVGRICDFPFLRHI